MRVPGCVLACIEKCTGTSLLSTAFITSPKNDRPLIYSISEDAVAAAKVINDFAKTNDKLVVKAGNFAGKSLDKAAVQALANIPSREVLLAQVVGMMQMPIAGFVRGLAALAAKKEAEAA